MKYRKKLYCGLLALALFMGFSVEKACAQYMPVVYDRTYGDNTKFQHACPASAGEVVLVGTQNEITNVTWVKRTGEVGISRTLPTGFISINKVTHLGDNKILILGQGRASTKGKNGANSRGRAVIMDNEGNLTTDFYVGATGSALLYGQILKDGDIVVSGYELNAVGQKAGLIAKVTLNGKEVYKYTSTESGSCTSFDVLGTSSKQYVNAAFTGDNGGTASVVRLDPKGMPIYVTNLPDQAFDIKKILTDIDGYVYLIGNSIKGGRVLKLRNEGNIVFDKEIVPASALASIEHLFVASNGTILVGGNGGDRCYYSLLRNDGTDIQKYIMQGSISGMGLNSISGEAVVVGYDSSRGRGTIIGLEKDGRQIFQKSTDGNFDRSRLTPHGIFLASSTSGRISMLSNMGELLFDRYAIDDINGTFDDVCFTNSGEIILSGFSNRLVKIGHGLYLSDVKINKPVDGFTTATFTVTLTGYAMTDQNTPIPVTVEYGTKAATAKEGANYTATKGSLSFVPANDGANQYMVKQEVEVPITANSLIEGRKLFEMQLANVNESYLIKPIGTGVIEDQEVLVKLVKTENGLEAQKDVVYELGLFKTNGAVVSNGTGADIIIDGVYGKGTADGLDYDMGISPRVVISSGSKTGKFSVKTLEDTRYELPKSVVVDFKEIHAISDANVSFESSLLSCAGIIVDQPAYLSINALGDHGRMSNVVSGFFRVSLVRQSDGVLLTNATGGDIAATCSVVSGSTAVDGKDFVLTNLYDLRIWGDGNRSAVNLNGVVLFNRGVAGAKKINVKIDSVKTPDKAPQIKIDPKAASAGFTIKD